MSSTWYLFRNKQYLPKKWNRLVEFDECGYFCGQYMYISLGTPTKYTPPKDDLVSDSWNRLFPTKRGKILPEKEFEFKYIPEEEVVLLIMNNFKNLKDYK